MTKLTLYLFLFIPCLFFGFSSCNNQVKKQVPFELVEKTDSCKVNPQHTYQVIVPKLEKPCANLPLLLIVDPHGAGKYAVSRFNESALKYPVVIVASNLIKNNFTGYIKSLDELIADVKSKYPVDKAIYLGGFSGGARMVIDYATTHRVNGVIACGALAQPEQIEAIKCKVIAVMGMDDFNFIEVVQYVVNPNDIPKHLFVEITNASHGWPEKELLTTAMGFLQLSGNEPTDCFNLKSKKKAFISEQKSSIDSLYHSTEVLKAALKAHNMIDFCEVDKKSPFQPIYDEMVKSENYKKQQDELTQSIRFEVKVREAYYKALQEKDVEWWEKEITNLNMKIDQEENIYPKMAYRRIKGFLGIVCYSLSNRFATNKEKENLEKILDIYRMVDPNNTDLTHFNEILSQLKRN